MPGGARPPAGRTRRDDPLRLDGAANARSVHPEGVAQPPVLVFFHGGYWQELSKQESAFAASHCLAARHRLRRRRLHAGAVRHAVRRSSRNAAPPSRASSRFDRLVVAGSSAGAHLAAMAALSATRGERGGAGVRHLRSRAADRHLDRRSSRSRCRHGGAQQPAAPAAERIPAQPGLLGRERNRSVQAAKRRLYRRRCVKAGTDARRSSVPAATISTSSWISSIPPRISGGGRSI